MKVNDFYDWIRRIPRLSKRQREVCLKQIYQRSGNSEKCGVPAVIAEAQADCCPDCSYRSLHRWGQASGLRRWKCLDCGRTFNILTGTPLARLRKKDKWPENAAAMIAGLTVRKTAEKCQVHRNTSFRWRHRFLTYHGKAQHTDLQGIAECDATCFYRSEKGSRTLDRKPRKRGGDGIKPGKSDDLVAVLTLRDRSGKGADRVALEGQQTPASDLFRTHLRDDTLLITDGCTELCAAAKGRDPSAHLSLPGLEGKGSPFHIQTVNAFHSDLKAWMTRFKGVATKYLANYAGWHRQMFEDNHHNDPETFILLSFNPLAVNPQLTVT